MIFSLILIWFDFCHFPAQLLWKSLIILTASGCPFFRKQKSKKGNWCLFVNCFCLSNGNAGGMKPNIFEKKTMTGMRMRMMMMVWWGCIQQILNNCEDRSVTKFKLAENPNHQPRWENMIKSNRNTFCNLDKYICQFGQIYFKNKGILINCEDTYVCH